MHLGAYCPMWHKANYVHEATTVYKESDHSDVKKSTSIDCLRNEMMDVKVNRR